MNRSFAVAGLLLSLGLSGCNGFKLPTEETAYLPRIDYAGAGDPVRAAIGNTAYVFSAPGTMAGRPAAAARAIAEMEYLRVEVMFNPRSSGGGEVTASTLYPSAQREWRRALGIAPAAPAQAVIDGLFGVARALGNGQEGAAAAALNPAVFTLGATQTLARLAALPDLPITNQAAQETTRALRRIGTAR